MSKIVHRTNRSERISRFAESSDDDDDEENDDENDEHERLLSDVHGEAAEAPASKKRELKEEDIEAEYTKTKPKKPRIVLTESDVTGMKGLIRIPTEFSKMKLPANKTKVDAAALYAKQLIHQYKLFCYDLFPGLAMEDVLARLETFGSKKQVKMYVSNMRDEIRNKHLEKHFGKDTAERLVQELQEGLAQSEMEAREEHEEDDPVLPVQHRTTRSVAVSEETTTPPAVANMTTATDSDEEDEAMFNDVGPTKKRVILDDTDDDETHEKAPTDGDEDSPVTRFTSAAPPVTPRATLVSGPVDTDDEDEAMFDDVAPSKQRAVLEDTAEEPIEKAVEVRTEDEGDSEGPAQETMKSTELVTETQLETTPVATNDENDQETEKSMEIEEPMKDKAVEGSSLCSTPFYLSQTTESTPEVPTQLATDTQATSQGCFLTEEENSDEAPTTVVATEKN
jgi:hypothetical protein